MNRARIYQSRLYQASSKAIPYQELVRMTPTLLSPLAAISIVMAVWRFGSDIGWTDTFVVSDGLLSHWQVWLALGIGILWTGNRLDRLTAHGQKKP